MIDWRIIINQLAIVFGGIFVFMILLPNIITRGFLVAYLRVRMSMGKKILIHVKKDYDSNYEVGYIEEGFLVRPIKKKKDEKTQTWIKEIRYNLDTTKSYYENILGVKCINVDEEARVYYYNVETISAVTGYDLKRHSMLSKRALTSSESLEDNEEEEKKRWTMTWLLIGIAIIAIIVAVVFIMKHYDPMLSAINNNVGELIKAAPNTVK
jgi:hypothetical protein